jgi:predicted nuclease with TOPRIM domain
MECNNQCRHECEHRFRTIEKSISSIDDKIKELEEHKEKSNIDIALLCQKVESLCDKVDDLTDKIDVLTSKDGQKWDKVVWIVITAVVSAVVGYMLSRVGI